MQQRGGLAPHSLTSSLPGCFTFITVQIIIIIIIILCVQCIHILLFLLLLLLSSQQLLEDLKLLWGRAGQAGQEVFLRELQDVLQFWVTNLGLSDRKSVV